MTTRFNILLSIFLTFQVGQLFACSCDDLPTVQESIKYSDVVVVGTFLTKEIIKVSQFDSSNNNTKKGELYIAKYGFLIQDYYKGSITADTLTILTGGLGSSDCGIRFAIGQKYIIYGNYKSYFEHSNLKINLPFSTNTLWTHSCSRTMYFNNFEKKKIEKILTKQNNKFTGTTVPIFINGGESGLKDFISKNINYPNDGCVSGNVYTNFTVDKNGNVKNIVVLKGITKGTDKEALRIVNLLTFIPATKNGKPTEANMNLRINFTLDYEDKK